TFGVAYPASEASRSSTRPASAPIPRAIISAAIVRIAAYRSMSYGFSANVKPVWARAFSLRAQPSYAGSISSPLLAGVCDISLPDPRNQPVSDTLCVFLIARQLVLERPILQDRPHDQERIHDHGGDQSPQGAECQRDAEEEREAEDVSRMPDD